MPIRDVVPNDFSDVEEGNDGMPNVTAQFRVERAFKDNWDGVTFWRKLLEEYECPEGDIERCVVGFNRIIHILNTLPDAPTEQQLREKFMISRKA